MIEASDSSKNDICFAKAVASGHIKAIALSLTGPLEINQIVRHGVWSRTQWCFFFFGRGGYSYVVEWLYAFVI